MYYRFATPYYLWKRAIRKAMEDIGDISTPIRTIKMYRHTYMGFTSINLSRDNNRKWWVEQARLSRAKHKVFNATYLK